MRLAQFFCPVVITSLTFSCASLHKPVLASNEFRYLGNAIVCITDTDNQAPSLMPCMHIGGVGVGDDLGAVRKRLGEPYTTTKHKATGETVHIYVLKGTSQIAPYLAIYEMEEKITAVQLTGTHIDAAIHFSSIHLGDAAAKTREILGEPTGREIDGETGNDLLSYHPFPISIEIKNGKVFSIKIWSPADKSKAPH